jgi:hypothetical protein
LLPLLPVGEKGEQAASPIFVYVFPPYQLGAAGVAALPLSAFACSQRAWLTMEAVFDEFVQHHP